MSPIEPIQRVMGTAPKGIDRIRPLTALARLDRDEPRDGEDDEGDERSRPRPRKPAARRRPDDGLPHIDVRA